MSPQSQREAGVRRRGERRRESDRQRRGRRGRERGRRKGRQTIKKSQMLLLKVRDAYAAVMNMEGFEGRSDLVNAAYVCFAGGMTDQAAKTTEEKKAEGAKVTSEGSKKRVVKVNLTSEVTTLDLPPPSDASRLTSVTK